MFLRLIIQYTKSLSAFDLPLRCGDIRRILLAVTDGLMSVLCFGSQKLRLTFLSPSPVTFDTKVGR